MPLTNHPRLGWGIYDLERMIVMPGRSVAEIVQRERLTVERAAALYHLTVEEVRECLARFGPSETPTPETAPEPPQE